MYNTKQQENPEHYQITLAQYKVRKKSKQKFFDGQPLCKRQKS